MNIKEYKKALKGQINEESELVGLKNLIDISELSQKDLANMMGCSESWISQILKGKIEKSDNRNYALFIIRGLVRHVCAEKYAKNQLSPQNAMEIRSFLIQVGQMHFFEAYRNDMLKKFKIKDDSFLIPETIEEWMFFSGALMQAYQNWISWKIKKINN